MNKSRELFLLFPDQEVIPQGYCRIYAFTSMNDEPPYKMCTFWGIGNMYGGVYEEDGESIFYFLIREQDAQNFIKMKKSTTDTFKHGIAKLMLAADYTGYFDDNGSPIYVGQKLKSQWNYEIIVCKSDDGSFYGQLVCDDNHSCKNIPYALNDGMGHTICG